MQISPIEDIDPAVLAERERIAAIADKLAADAWGMTEEEFAYQNIASIIRTGLDLNGEPYGDGD